MDFSTLIRDRYSVRKFSPDPVSREEIERLLAEAQTAPTAVNHQPQRYLVITSPEGMEKLARCTKYNFGAPCAIVVCCNRDEAWVNPYTKQNKFEIDAAIVATHLMLAVHDAGLGACWIGCFDPAKIAEEFHLPASVEPVAVFPVGHIAEDCTPAAKHHSRKAAAELTVWETF